MASINACKHSCCLCQQARTFCRTRSIGVLGKDGLGAVGKQLDDVVWHSRCEVSIPSIVPSAHDGAFSEHVISCVASTL